MKKIFRKGFGGMMELVNAAIIAILHKEKPQQQQQHPHSSQQQQHLI